MSSIPEWPAEPTREQQKLAKQRGCDFNAALKREARRNSARAGYADCAKATEELPQVMRDRLDEPAGWVEFSVES